MTSRLQLIEAARKWIQTPYAHKGRKRGKAADCLFHLSICEQLGISDKYGVPIKADDYPEYDHQPKDSFIHQEAVRRLIRKSASDLLPGDMVILRYGGSVPSHSAIVGEFCSPNYNTLTLIHCDGKEIVEHALSRAWKKRVVAAFSFPNIH
ncbi:MAG TPA: hypothetical protein VJS37_05335 [Terriglobales bacterium]|nr:hypothetical protein [Terriglobales bacterium]